jgi:hypothetical protein
VGGRVAQLACPVGSTQLAWQRCRPSPRQLLASRLRPDSKRAYRQFQPTCLVQSKFLFRFPELIQIAVAFQNSYLFEYLSKIHETSSIGFVISISIKEKYQTKQ